MQFSNLHIIEPVAHALTVQVHDFGIDIIHVNTFCRGLVYVQYFKRQKTPATCRVGQELVAVYRSHEAGEVGVFLYVNVIRSAVFHRRGGDKVLQCVLVLLVEFL